MHSRRLRTLNTRAGAEAPVAGVVAIPAQAEALGERVARGLAAGEAPERAPVAPGPVARAVARRGIPAVRVAAVRQRPPITIRIATTSITPITNPVASFLNCRRRSPPINKFSQNSQKAPV